MLLGKPTTLSQHPGSKTYLIFTTTNRSFHKYNLSGTKQQSKYNYLNQSHVKGIFLFFILMYSNQTIAKRFVTNISSF